jgi:hypothetical protein
MKPVMCAAIVMLFGCAAEEQPEPALKCENRHYGSDKNWSMCYPFDSENPKYDTRTVIMPTRCAPPPRWFEGKEFQYCMPQGRAQKDSTECVWFAPQDAPYCQQIVWRRCRLTDPVWRETQSQCCPSCAP